MPAAVMQAVRGKWSLQHIRLALYALALTFDALSVSAGFLFAGLWRDDRWLSPQGHHVALLAVPIFIMFALGREAYSIETLRSLSEGIRRPLSALLSAMLIILMFTFFSQTGQSISRFAFALAFGGALLAMAAGRLIIHRIVWWKMAGVVTDELILADGMPVTALGGARAIDAQRTGLNPDPTDPQALSRLSAVISNYDRVIIACPPERRAHWALFLKGSDVGGEIIVRDANNLGAVAIGEYDGSDTLVVSRGPLSLAKRAQKRAFDLAITIPILIFLMPLLLVVALAIRLESAGPVLFRQPRVGQGNRLFTIFKFRSMRSEVLDTHGNRSTQKDDDRITRIGRIIRMTSIDELPQLLNVLRGDMSLVGPRPHALGSLAGDKLFWEVNERYWLRHALKPGITGLAQIRGFRGTTHRQEDLEDRLQSDLEYLDGWQLWRDITILFGTAKVLVHPNAY